MCIAIIWLCELSLTDKFIFILQNYLWWFFVEYILPKQLKNYFPHTYTRLNLTLLRTNYDLFLFIWLFNKYLLGCNSTQVSWACCVKSTWSWLCPSIRSKFMSNSKFTVHGGFNCISIPIPTLPLVALMETKTSY